MDICQSPDIIVHPTGWSAYYTESLPEEGVPGIYYVVPVDDTVAVYKWDDITNEWVHA